MPVIRIHDVKFIQKIFRERSTVLNQSIDNLQICKHQLTGSVVSEEVQNKYNKEQILEDYSVINPTSPGNIKLKKGGGGDSSYETSPSRSIKFVETTNTPIPSRNEDLK